MDVYTPVGALVVVGRGPVPDEPARSLGGESPPAVQPARSRALTTAREREDTIPGDGGDGEQFRGTARRATGYVADGHF